MYKYCISHWCQPLPLEKLRSKLSTHFAQTPPQVSSSSWPFSLVSRPIHSARLLPLPDGVELSRVWKSKGRTMISQYMFYMFYMFFCLMFQVNGAKRGEHQSEKSCLQGQLPRLSSDKPSQLLIEYGKKLGILFEICFVVDPELLHFGIY